MAMELRRKLEILADAAKYDASCASSGSKRANNGSQLGDTSKIGICHSYTPDGRCVSLLKILLTNHCIYDCCYCVSRVSNDRPRARFTVDEVVTLTIEFYKRNYIEGLFLSSGVIQSVDYTMEQLILVAKTLRTVHQYNGYIHLKAVPGASPELLREAGLWADRLSANIELPTEADLRRYAPDKKPGDIESTMAEIKLGVDASKAERKQSKLAPVFAPAGQSTQLIIGATASTDADILSTATRLYSTHRLKRVYYSAFSPIPGFDDRLPTVAPPLQREHRLYQADWLVRFYGFEAREITTPAQPNLSLEIDPKLSWALVNRARFPVDLNRAAREMLLRVPGLGVRNVDRIIKIRRHHRIRLEDLTRLRTSVRRAKPFITTADYCPRPGSIDSDEMARSMVRQEKQLSLFDLVSSARTGEV